MSYYIILCLRKFVFLCTRCIFKQGELFQILFLTITIMMIIVKRPLCMKFICIHINIKDVIKDRSRSWTKNFPEQFFDGVAHEKWF